MSEEGKRALNEAEKTLQQARNDNDKVDMVQGVLMGMLEDNKKFFDEAIKTCDQLKEEVQTNNRTLLELRNSVAALLELIEETERKHNIQYKDSDNNKA